MSKEGQTGTVPEVKHMVRELAYWPPGATEPIPIRVSIGIPEQDADGTDWSCTLSIDGFDKPCSMALPGTDAISALLRALSLAPHVLRSRTPSGGRLTWLGEEDLRFSTTPP
jgi:hypothetical protein